MQRVLNKKTNRWEEQYRAKRKQGSLEKMKSKVVNLLTDRTEERKLITQLIRGSVQLKKEKEIDLSSYRKTKKLFKLALEHMPEDMRQWQYGYGTIAPARPYIEEIVDLYLEKYYKREMKELHRVLDEEVLAMKELYGEGSNYQNYKQTQLDDLKKRMGNAVLKEMREYSKKERANGSPLSNRSSFANGTDGNQRMGANAELNRALINLNFRMRKTFQDYKKDRNLDEFDRMLDGYER